MVASEAEIKSLDEPRSQTLQIADNAAGVVDWRKAFSEFGGSEFVVEVVQKAAHAIMDIYERDCAVAAKGKEDGSPLTEADLCSASIIERALRARSGIPVICEESVTGLEVPGDFFWLVDPLDGTKEFINRNGEFTVNVALVCGTMPVVGVIGVPATGEYYCAVDGEGTFRLQGDKRTRVSNCRVDNDLVAAVSRSHAAPTVAAYLQRCGITRSIECGSALKFCRLAEGVSDIYVRFGRTMEWDTAAGQCLLKEANCKVFASETGQVLTYGKNGFANPSFIACRNNLKVPLAS